MARPPSSTQQRPKRGPVRRATLFVLLALTVWLIAVGSVRVTQQALFPDPGQTSFNCRGGALALLGALESARDRAREHTRGEREALSAFRSDLAAVWDQSWAIRAECEAQQDKEALRALRSLDLLRYAEERSIRLSAVELAHLRRSTPRLVYALSARTP